MAACERTYLCQKIGKRKAFVSGKRVDLTGGCGDVTDRRAKLHDHNHNCHACRGTDWSRGIEEDLDEGEACFRLKHFINVAHTERKCDNHDQASGPVED